MDAQSAFAPFLALIRGAVANELAARMLREFLAREVLERPTTTDDISSRSAISTLESPSAA